MKKSILLSLVLQHETSLYFITAAFIFILWEEWLFTQINDIFLT